MAKEVKNRYCPYCKEEIKGDAIKCKHCHSSITPDTPMHEGICPYCKEEIKKDATKCKHCKSNLLSQSQVDCGCGTSIPIHEQNTVFAGALVGSGPILQGIKCYVTCYSLCRGLGGPHSECALTCGHICYWANSPSGPVIV